MLRERLQHAKQRAREARRASGFDHDEDSSGSDTEMGNIMRAEKAWRRVKSDAGLEATRDSHSDELMPEVWGGPTPAVVQKLRLKGLSTKGNQKACMARLWKQTLKEKHAVRISKKHGAIPEAEGGPSLLLLEKLRAKELAVDGDKRECMMRLLKVTKLEAQDAGALREEWGGPDLSLIGRLQQRKLSILGTREECLARIAEAARAQVVAAKASPRVSSQDEKSKNLQSGSSSGLDEQEIEEEGVPMSPSDGGPGENLVAHLREKALSVKGNKNECLARLLDFSRAEMAAVDEALSAGAIPEDRGGPSLGLFFKLESRGLAVTGTKKEATARLMKATQEERMTAAESSSKAGVNLKEMFP